MWRNCAGSVQAFSTLFGNITLYLADKNWKTKLADITHCDWEEMRQKEMTKKRIGEEDVKVKQDLKE